MTLGRVLSALVLLAIAAALCGCGGGASASTARSAGQGAAAFRVAGADNSIPDFGTEAPAAQRRAAGAALSRYLTARAAGRWGAACAVLASAVMTQVEGFAPGGPGGARCARGLALLPHATGSPAEAPRRGLAALRRKGAGAFALYYGAHDQQYVMPMKLEGGAWKVTQPAPIAYPLGAEAPGSP